MRIFKYLLKMEGKQKIDLPENARILTVQTQNGIPCIWAIVDEESTKTKHHTIRTYGTGHPFDSHIHCFYVGTYQLNGGNLVFHVFDESE